MFEWISSFVAIIASGVASVTGFGIGSILTPLIHTQFDLKVAVAFVSIPHFIATFQRFWTLRKAINKKLLIQFGVPSALGGCLGALMHSMAHGKALSILFGCLLLFTGIADLLGYLKKLRFHKRFALWAGGLSGLLGGLVGNQGGIRSAAILSFSIDKTSFIATATAIGVIVDLARMPVYLFYYSDVLIQGYPLWGGMIIGAVVGTYFGMKILNKINESTFRKIIDACLIILGSYMILTA